jgi:hypothetical protein
MNRLTLDVFDVVRRNVLSRGPQGAAWLRDLARIVAELATEWSLQVGRSLRGGTESFVVVARTVERAEAVLKIALLARGPCVPLGRGEGAAAGGDPRFRGDRRQLGRA